MALSLDKTSVKGPSVWLVVASLALAACSAGSNPSSQQPVVVATQQPQSPETMPALPPGSQGNEAGGSVSTEAAPLEPAETQAPAASATQAAETPTQPAPTPRQDLFASDPGSVEIASGEYQFIEFFAFW